MQIARRLYLYVMSGVMLAILAVGLRMLATVLFDAIGIGAGVVIQGNQDRETLSLAGALVGVGLPVWLIHWWLVRRGVEPRRPGAEEERQSGVRALYLSGVLAVSLVFVAGAALDVLRAAMTALLGVSSSFGPQPDAAEGVATLLIAGAVWLFHAVVRGEDLAGGPLEDGAVWWPRIYVYGAIFVALAVGIGAFDELVKALASLLVDPAAAFGDARDLQIAALSHAGVIAVATAVLVPHARYAQLLPVDPGWPGESERPSRLRVAFFVLVLGVAAVAVLLDLITAARALLLEVLGAEADPGLLPAEAGDTLRRVVLTVLAGTPWLAAGLIARGRALGEAARSGLPGRAASVGRLETYVLATIGLAFGGVGLGWLLGLGIDAMFGGQRLSLTATDWKVELASFLASAVLGLALWAWSWWRVMTRSAMDPAEAGSSMRRASLLLVLAVSLTVMVTSLAVILYRLFNALLGVPLGGSVVAELSSPAGALIVAAAAAIYHGLLVRSDVRLRAARSPGQLGTLPPDPPQPPTVPGGGPEAPVAVTEAAPAPGAILAASRSLVLRAASPAELEAALTRLRANLALGSQLDDR